MKLLSFLRVPFVLLIITGFISDPGLDHFPEVSQRQRVKNSGLTKTLVNLMKTRSPKKLFLGACEISMEDMIDTDVASLFDCDSVINKYLSDTGEGATYEMLSDALKNTIRDRFRNDEGALFVNVSSDTTSEGMYINFSVFRDREISIPVVLNASDTSFSTTFDTTCTVKFESDIDLFINTGKVNAGSKKDGVKIRINKLLFELTSGTGDEEYTGDTDCQETESEDSSAYVTKPQKTIPFYLRGKEYTAAARCFSIYAASYWYLCPAGATDFMEDEGKCYTLSFKQLEKGQFRWDNEILSSFSTRIVMIPAGAPWDSLTFAEKSNEFSYVVDDLFDNSGQEQISLCCDYGINEGVTARSKKPSLPVSRRSR